MSGRDQYYDDNIKHLEFLQSAISRLATNSFLIKGWTLTITAAILGFAASNSNRAVSLVAVTVIIAFWLLDAYFLRQERLYRRLFEAVSKNDGSVPRFSMSTTPYRKTEKLIRIIFRPTLGVFYCALLTVALAVTIVAPNLTKLR